MTNTPTLNADQLGAMTSINAFLVSAEREFLMTGGPGVGKTFTTQEIVRTVRTTLKKYATAMGKKHRDMSLVLTSTTNKAAAVLEEQTGHPATTIHSFLSVIPFKDYHTGATKLKRTSQWRVYSDVILIIDEASMIDNNLHTLLSEAMDETCKIIYVGDKNQLPPVMEKLSRAMELASDPAKHYEIKTPVRNAGAPALMSLCNRLRDDILNETPKDQLTNWPEAPGEIQYINGTEFQDLVAQTYGPGGPVQATDQEMKCRILCYTNRAVIDYNEHIRALRGLPSTPTVGEFLICNNHHKISRSVSLNVEEEVRIDNIGPNETIKVDAYNSLEATPIEIVSANKGRHTVQMAVDPDQVQALMREYKKRKQWVDFFRVKEMFIDLRNREASTVYKAQGSTYDTVIMVMKDIFSSRDLNQLRRMLYVGASRARKNIYLYDEGIHSNQRGIYK